MALLLVVVCVCIATAAGDLRSLSHEKILDMLRSWDLDDKFGSVCFKFCNEFVVCSKLLTMQFNNTNARPFLTGF